MQRRVLLVDNEPAACQLIQKVVAATGMEVLTLASGSQASDHLNGSKFDLLFLNFHMASPDGLELARQARQSRLNRTTPIILVSDDQRPSAMTVAFAAGANFFFYKPIDRVRLLKLVQSIQATIDHERRRVRRIPSRHKVLLGFSSGQCEAETIDISLNGILVRAPRVFPPGSPVHLSLELAAGTRPVVGRGYVARTVGNTQMGIHMASLSASESQKLEEFLLPLTSEPA